MAVRFTLVAVFAFLSCTAPRAVLRDIREPKSVRIAIQTPVWIDGRFPAAPKAEVESALARWNDALGGCRVFVIAADDLDRPRDWLGMAEHPLGWGATFTYNATSPEGVDSGFLAQVRGEADVQFYGDHFRRGEGYEAVALHEVGHVLGLFDNEPGARLMLAEWRPNQTCIDRGTIARIARRHPTWTSELRAECE